MRCRQCDYLLWNLRSRLCPECGAAFRPSEFEFPPGAVQFLCPHCQQRYFGTAMNGHLEPSRFECVQCHQSIAMDDCILQPAAGVAEEDAANVQVPWCERKRRGIVNAWINTVDMSMTRPEELMRLLPATASNRAALGFALLTQACSLFGVVLLFGLFLLLNALSVPNAAGVLWASMIFGMIALGGIVLLTAFLWLWAALAQVLLRLTGTATGDFRRTFQAICYSSGANLLSIIICFPSIGPIWWLVSAVRMMRTAHRLPIWRAVLVTLPPPLLPGLLFYPRLLNF